MSALLSLSGVHAYYGTSHALQGVSIDVQDQEIVGLLGRNGAGKTTTIRTILGLTPRREGHISLAGQDIAHARPYEIARLGVAYIPSGRRAFGGLTVEQNLILGGAKKRAGTWSLKRIYDLFPQLREIAGRTSRHLSGGEQQMLKIGRALAANPRVVLLDEPTEGLAPKIVADLKNWLSTLRSEGVTMLLAEQSATFAMSLCNTAYVLEKGVVRYSGTPEQWQQNPEIRTYLGVGGSIPRKERDA